MCKDGCRRSKVQALRQIGRDPSLDVDDVRHLSHATSLDPNTCMLCDPSSSSDERGYGGGKKAGG